MFLIRLNFYEISLNEISSLLICNISEILDPLPEINTTLTSVEKFRYHMNVCTFGHTFAFGKWPQWEKHIDWMALNGTNLPLAFVGQEAIWERVYTKVWYLKR